MNKDALLATLIGFGIGLVITGAFLFGPTILASLPAVSFKLPTFSRLTQPNVSPVPSRAPPVTELTVTAPLPDTLVDKDELLVSGTAPGGSTIVVASSTDEDVVTANGTGTFAGKVTLLEGKNDVVVTSYLEGNEETETITVFYTPEEF